MIFLPCARRIYTFIFDKINVSIMIRRKSFTILHSVSKLSFFPSEGRFFDQRKIIGWKQMTYCYFKNILYSILSHFLLHLSTGKSWIHWCKIEIELLLFHFGKQRRFLTYNFFFYSFWERSKQWFFSVFFSYLFATTSKIMPRKKESFSYKDINKPCLHLRRIYQVGHSWKCKKTDFT
jgi:hypothetical protein